MGASKLSDLDGLTVQHLCREKNCGRETVAELLKLLARIEAGEFDPLPASGGEVDLAQLILFLNLSLGQLKGRDREILLLRLGAEGAPMTLEETGARYGLTRERVRQIAERALDSVKRNCPQLDALLRVLAEKCLTDVCPLTPSTLGHWLGRDTAILRFPAPVYVRIMSELHPNLPAWPDEQWSFESKTSRATRLIGYLRDALQAATRLPLSEAFRQLASTGQFPEVTAREFLAAIKDRSSLRVEFVAPDRPMLSLPRMKGRDLARYVLARSERPLTPEEIVECAQQLLGSDYEPVAPRTLANILKPEDGFYLLDACAFGLRRHFTTPTGLWEQMRADCLQLMQKENRMISTTEIINRREFLWTAFTNIYELAQILREDNRFADLGRLQFALATSGIEKRAHVDELLLEVLEQTGRPMTQHEILEKIRRVRSVSRITVAGYLRSHQNVRRYGRGLYGLRLWSGAILQQDLPLEESNEQWMGDDAAAQKTYSTYERITC
jgi:hypothetical protein